MVRLWRLWLRGWGRWQLFRWPLMVHPTKGLPLRPPVAFRCSLGKNNAARPTAVLGREVSRCVSVRWEMTMRSWLELEGLVPASWRTSGHGCGTWCGTTGH